MSTIRRMMVMTIVILSAIFCFAQFGQKKQATTGCSKYQQPAVTISIGSAEDFRLINLLTLKFM